MSNCGKSLKRCLRTTRIHAVQRKTHYEMNDNCRELRVQRVNDHLTPEGPEVDSQSAPPLPHLRPPVNTGVSPVIYCCFFNIPGSENAAAVQSLESGALFSSAVNRELHHNLCAPGFCAIRVGCIMTHDMLGMHDADSFS